VSSSADAELARLWEEFERDGDDPVNLLAFASRYPQSGTACGHRYPFLHRIGDAPSGGPGTGLRLLRCTKCEARLFLVPCTTLSPQAGVPLWLRGVLLAR